MTKRLLIILLTVFSFAFLQSCGGSDFTVFENKVKEFGKDNIISVEEWQDIKEDIELHSSDRDFNRFFTNKELDDNKIDRYITDLGFVIEEEQTDDPSKKIINIYIENSGSMFGFVSGNTGFKNALTKLIVDLKHKNYKEENIKFHFINKKITPITITGRIENYPISLSGSIMRDFDSNDSNINDIYKQILENTSENVISILFSDCIYSVHQDIRNDDVEGALRIWETRTVGVFNDAIKTKELSTLLVQLTSDFTGNYYTKTNKPIYLNKQQIPYYITVIGEEKELNKFSFVDKLDGFQNKLIFTTQDYSKNSFYSLVQTNEDNGSYKPSRDRNSNANIVQSIESIRIPGRGDDRFIFSVAVDFSKLPVDENYLLQENNYTIDKGDYKIASIFPYDKNILKPSSLVKLEKNKETPTHIIVFESTSEKYSDLVFSLNKNVPEWIYKWNTNDDSDIRTNPNQTFGIKYLAEGIFEAYQNTSTNKDYITLTINIKK